MSKTALQLPNEMRLYSVSPPTKYRAGYAGKSREAFYFDCADCGAKEPEIAGLIGTSPAFADTAVLGSDFPWRLAVFCPACYAARLAEIRAQSNPSH